MTPVRRASSLSAAVFVLFAAGCKPNADAAVDASPPKATPTSHSAVAEETPHVVAVLAKVRQVGAMALTPSALFVADIDPDDDNGTANLVRIPLDGGPAVVVARNQGSADGLSVVGLDLYWTASGGTANTQKDGLYAVGVGGGTPKRVAGAFVLADNATATDGTSLYYFGSLASDTAPETIMKVSAPTATATRVATCDRNATHQGLAVDGSNLYWFENQLLMKANAHTGASSAVGTAENSWGLATDGAYVYWTDRGSNAGPHDGVVRRAPIAGGAPEVIATGLFMPWGIALDDRSLYWVTNGDGAGRLYSRLKSGGATRVLAEGLLNPVNVAVGSSHVYWTNAGDGTVRTLTK